MGDDAHTIWLRAIVTDFENRDPHLARDQRVMAGLRDSV